MESGILGFGSRNLESHERLNSRIQVPLTVIQYLRNQRGSKAWNPESTIALDSFTWGELSITCPFTRQSAIKSKKNCLISRLNKKDDNATDDDNYDILLVLFYEERIKKTLLLPLILMQINPFCFALFLC